jgi:hypothetical protein
MGQIKIIAGNSPQSQDFAKKLTETIQHKYGSVAQNPAPQGAPGKTPEKLEPEVEAGD